MVRQQIKDLYFALNRILVLPNTLLARMRYRSAGRPGSPALRLHVGCGEKYLPGFINIDGYLGRRVDRWLDLRNALPFPDHSAELIYCSHTLEHLFPDEALRVLAEFRRILRPEGVARLVTPSLEHALKIAAGHPVEDPKRRFDHPAGQAIDYLFCDGQHKFAYSFEVLRDFARAAGFTRVDNHSGDPHPPPRRYGDIELGNELAGSLAVELRA